MAHILLIEDNVEMQALLSEVLSLGGHQVTTGRTGYEGLDLLASSETIPDVIISDLTMPQMDGLAFLQQIRQKPDWARIRFVMMSANPQDARLQIALTNHTINGLLSKPFTLNDLDYILRD